MTTLLIDTVIKREIQTIISYAEDNVIDINTLKRLADAHKDGKASPIGDNSQRTMRIPVGFLVSFSIEEHPIGLARHISVSSQRGTPSREAVNMIMHEFGFMPLALKDSSDRVYIALNEVPKYPVIDIIELMEETQERLH